MKVLSWIADKLIIEASTAPSKSAAPLPTSFASSTTAQHQSADPPLPLPYHVRRTASQQLPVYHLAKRGGNLHQTRIRKIEGDVESLMKEIKIALGLKEELVVINRLTGHVIIKVRECTDCLWHACGWTLQRCRGEESLADGHGPT